jgi:hypothetical protein
MWMSVLAFHAELRKNRAALAKAEGEKTTAKAS